MVYEASIDLVKLYDGEDGVSKDSKYIWIKYSQNEDGSNMTDDSTNAIYMGVSYNKETPDESDNPSDYEWSKIQGEKGDNGLDGYTVFLTNQNESFTADTSGNITSAIIKTTEVKAYRGSEVVTPTIGTLPIVSGLTLSKSGTKITIQANTGTSLSDTGSFDIPVTVDGISFILTFSWTKITNLSDQQYEEVVGIKEQVLANKEEIASAKLEIDQNKKDIQAKVSADVFNNTVTTLENDIEKANQGVGKWLIEIYPKSLFDSEEQSKYEMSVFTSHTDIMPDQSFLVDDDSLSHTSTYADNYIGYALTFVECDAAFSVTTKVYYNDAFNLYLNNGMEGTGDSSSSGDTGVDVTINFRKGWNCLEVVWNESTGTDGFKLGTTLSELSHVISVNCYHASITGRENQVVNRYAELKIDVDGITSRVEKTESDVTVLDGKTQTLDQQYSEMQQDYNGFKTTVAATYVTQDDLDNVNVGGTNLIRNSETLQYVDYSFDGDTLATYDNGDVLTDENGDTLML